MDRRNATLVIAVVGALALVGAWRLANHDFMPLADECIEQARMRLPELEGMVAIGLDTVTDAELGGIVRRSPCGRTTRSMIPSCSSASRKPR
jgi:hypothetical protein